MNKHDFRRIIHAAYTVGFVLAAAGCNHAGLMADDAPGAGRQAHVSASQSSAASRSDDTSRAASMATPTLTELKHFVVYQRFHGLLNASSGNGPGAQYSGSSEAAADNSRTGRQVGADDAESAFSCLPSITSPEAGKEN